MTEKLQVAESDPLARSAVDTDGDGVKDCEDDDLDGDGALNKNDLDMDDDGLVDEDHEDPSGTGE